MTSRLSIKLDNFNFNKKDENLLIESGCFQLKWKRKYYLVTSHSFLPIKNNISLGEIKLNICINCVWNELLILKNGADKKCSIISEDLQTFDKIGIKVPPMGSDLYIKNKRFIVQEYCFSEAGFIEKYPKVVYMRFKKNKYDDNYLAGDPVYCDQNKLQGIVSLTDENNIYCLPSYYLIKTFEKENNFKIPTSDERITRINRHIVKNGLIFNPYLGINIPLTTFLVLEEDRQIEAYGESSDVSQIEVRFREFEKLPLMENKRNLIKDSKGYYNLSTAALHLMKHSYPSHLDKLYQIINNNPKINKMKFKVHKNYIKVAYNK